MNIFGVYFNPIVVAWSFFAGLMVGYLWGRSSGLRDGFERAKKQIEQQMANNAYIQAMQNMMRRDG